MNFIKLTDHNGFPIHINKLMVLTIEDWISGGSKIKMAMDDRIIKVKESPEQIIKQLTTIKTINYDS
jgi:hypothetical protein